MTNRPFWDFFINLGVIKWFCNLCICKKLMKNKFLQKIFNYEMITYLFFGVVATIINWGCYWLFCFIFMIPVNSPSPEHAFASGIANTIAFIIALIFAFITNKNIVFKSKKTTIKDTSREFISFTLARLLTFLLESAILTISNVLCLNLVVMKIIAGIIVVILNYIFSKLFIFNLKEQNNDISNKKI